jgi:hypothetical protein
MKDFISVYSITCPSCKIKQTGVVRESPGIVLTIPNSEPFHTIGGEERIPLGTHYIRCSYIHCQHIIMNDELAEVTQKVVKSPSDLRS